MGSLIPETTKKLITAEGLKEVAKQSQRMIPIPRRLKKAIENFLNEQEKEDMKKVVSKLSDTMNEFKNVSTQLKSADRCEDFRDIFDANEHSKQWKLKSSYEDAGLIYKDDETLAYVATRMHVVYCAAHRVLRDVKRRLPDFCPRHSALIAQVEHQSALPSLTFAYLGTQIFRSCFLELMALNYIDTSRIEK